MKFCLKRGWPVIISGSERTGKSTLVRVLRKHGYENVWEEFEPYKIVMKKQIPIDDCVPDLYRNIEE